MVRVSGCGQILVSAQGIPRIECIFFVLASEYGSTSRKDVMIPVFYERCDPNFELRNLIPLIHSGMDHVRSLKRARLNDYEIFIKLKDFKIKEGEKDNIKLLVTFFVPDHYQSNKR